MLLERYQKTQCLGRSYSIVGCFRNYVRSLCYQRKSLLKKHKLPINRLALSKKYFGAFWKHIHSLSTFSEGRKYFLSILWRQNTTVIPITKSMRKVFCVKPIPSNNDRTWWIYQLTLVLNYLCYSINKI